MAARRPVVKTLYEFCLKMTREPAPAWTYGDPGRNGWRSREERTIVGAGAARWCAARHGSRRAGPNRRRSDWRSRDGEAMSLELIEAHETGRGTIAVTFATERGVELLEGSCEEIARLAAV